MRKFVGVVAGLVLLAACAPDTVTDPLLGLSFVTTTAISPPGSKTLATTGTVTNENPDSVTVHYGSCPLDVLVHSGGYDGPILYQASAGRACATIALQKTLAPGETLTFTENDALTLAAGTYYITVEFAVNGFTDVHSGTITL